MKTRITLRAAFVAVMLALTLVAPAWADTVRPAMVAQAGGRSSLALQIANQTNAPHSYAVLVAGPTNDVTFTVTQDGMVVNSVKAGPNASVPVMVQADVPATAQLGTFEATFVAKRDDGAETTVAVTLDVQSTFGLKITSATKSITTFSGRDFAVDIAVTNTGTKAVDNLTAQMEMPPKWVLQSSPAKLSSLAPGAEGVFHLTVTVPASQVAVEEPIKVTVKSDEAVSPAADMKVRVQSNPVFLPITIGVVVIALIAVVVYFRLRGRR